MNHAPLYFGTTRWLVTLTVILVAIVEVLDITIVNVSLPNMMGTLGANSEQITWVLTSYIVSAAIFMPLTGFFIQRFGQKRLLLINIAGFLAASILCGISSSLTEMVLFRTCQGIFGASLVPLSQLILRDAFPLEEQGKAMAIWGVGIMVAPVLGPTLGGYITEVLNWRWVFFINIPVCILSFLLAWYLLIETPTRRQKIDWIGALLMAGGIASLQIFLDRGNQEGWLYNQRIK
jgi:MFS transporter, DHA2 family, multidrug resistance protein